MLGLYRLFSHHSFIAPFSLLSKHDNSDTEPLTQTDEAQINTILFQLAQATKPKDLGQRLQKQI